MGDLAGRVGSSIGDLGGAAAHALASAVQGMVDALSRAATTIGGFLPGGTLGLAVAVGVVLFLLWVMRR